ncbi:MAG: Uma2 family endonuclease [Gemmataceae bacterium]|nr:Uma2 family endonuclease [Gemmataceae bacterium]
MSTVLPPPTPRATIDDLMRVDGKAELIGGRVVRYMAVGHRPNQIAGRIYRRLCDYAESGRGGNCYTDGMGFRVPELPSGRESFSPDASYFTGPIPPDSMRFADGPPDFAAEVRSENDYGPAAEQEMAAKREDYFLAGTLVVWDVDPEAGTVTKYTAADPTHPTTFGPGQEADAEPAAPGWRLPVDWLMA